MSRQAVSVLTVAHDGWWERLSGALDLDAHTIPTEQSLTRIVRPQMERSLLDEAGTKVFVRYAKKAADISALDADSELVTRVTAKPVDCCTPSSATRCAVKWSGCRPGTPFASGMAFEP